MRSDRKNSDDPLADLPERSGGVQRKSRRYSIACIRTQSQNSDSERSTKVATKSRKHSISTHFPKDRDCDVCLRTKITRAPCRRRTGDALLRAEKFGDLITADHKVLNEGCDSFDNHEFAVVVQDLVSHWIQSYPCKTKSSHETKILGTITQTESCIHRQLDGIWESM